MHITQDDFNSLEDCTSFEIRAARKYNNQIANQLTQERIKAEKTRKNKNTKVSDFGMKVSDSVSKTVKL